MKRRLLCVVSLSIGLAGLAGCDQDQIGGYRLDVGPDGSMGPDGSPMSDADGSDGPDGSDGGENGSDLPGAGPEAPVFPYQPASNASCNEHDWCWVHPAPFPQRVYDLQAVDDRVFGVTRSEEFGGVAGVIWEGTSMQRITLELPSDKSIEDVTTSEDGWLAISADGTVYDVGPEGIRDSITVAEDELQRVIGNSLDNMIVRAPAERGVVVRDGESTVFDNIPGEQTTLRMGPDNRVWGLTDEESVQTAMDGDWRLFPLPEAYDPDETVTFGPAPGQACTPDGPWITDSWDSTFRWDASAGEWADVSSEDDLAETFGCDGDGNVVTVDRDGRLGTYSNGSWTYTDLTGRRLNDTALVGDKLYASGTTANHAVVDGENVTRIASGFWPPQPEAGLLPRGPMADIWVDGDETRMTLMHPAGIYRGSEPDGWEKMWGPPYAEDGGDRGELDLSQTRGASEVWGLDEPKFAMVQEHVLEWTGNAWIDISESDLDIYGITPPDPTGIAGRREDSVWAAVEERLYRYDGEAWTELTASGTQLGEKLRGNWPTSIHVTDDDRVLVARDSSFEQLQQGNTGWELVDVQSTPCEDDILDRYRDEDGTLWVAGRAPCAASLTDGEWTNYTFPLDPDTITYTDRSRTWVEQPGDGPPLLIAYHGIYEPQPDGTMEIQFRGEMMDAVYVESANAIYAVHKDGVLAKFGDD